MGAVMNARVWKKAYMLEFLIDGKLEDTFTFSVPPESEELDFPHRISETKTFGGSVFDDYGNDTIKLTLAGTTVNEEKKIIYRGRGKRDYLTGEREVYELQKLITKWQEIDDNQKNKAIYLYDLSKMTYAQFAAGMASRNYWKVVIKNLKIKRDKQAPFTYKYTLEFTAMLDEQRKGAEAATTGVLNALAAKVANSAEKIQEFADKTELVADTVAEVAARIKKVVKTFKELKGASPYKIASTILKAGDSGLRIITGNTNNTFFNVAKDVLTVAETLGINVGASGIYSNASKTYKSQNTRKLTVGFNSMGGSPVKSQTVEYCKFAVKPENPTKENHLFSGWFADYECRNEFDFREEITAGISLYAKWTFAVATVQFNSMGGSQIGNEKVTVGGCAAKPENPARRGYAFVAWTTDASGNTPYDFSTPVERNMTLYAKWQRVCVVTFDSNGGSPVEPQSVAQGGLAVYPITPVKENYTFASWCIDAALESNCDFYLPVTSDITLYAKYVQHANTVSFDTDGGSAVEAQHVPIGETAGEPETPERTGFDFGGWYKDSARTEAFDFADTPINADTTVYAKWTVKVFKISFSPTGGTAVPPQFVNYGELVVFPMIPYREFYVFAKWLKGDSTEYDFSTPVTESFTLTAEWFGGRQ